MLYPLGDLSNEAVCATIDQRAVLKGETSVARKEQVSSARKTDKSRASGGGEARGASRTGTQRITDKQSKSKSRVVKGPPQLQTSASSNGMTPSPFTRPRGSRATPPIPTLAEGHKSHITSGASPDPRNLQGRDERRSTRASSRSWAREKHEEESKKHLSYGQLNSFGGAVTTQQMSAYYAQQVNHLNRNLADMATVSLRRLSKGHQVVSSPGIRGFEEREHPNSEANKSVNLSEDESSPGEDEESLSKEESSEVEVQIRTNFNPSTLLTLEPSKVTVTTHREQPTKPSTTAKLTKAGLDPTQGVFPPSPTKGNASKKAAATKKTAAYTSSGARPANQRLEDLRSSNSSKVGLNKQPGETTVEDLLHMRSFSKHGTTRATVNAPSKGIMPKPSVREEKTAGLVPSKVGLATSGNYSGLSGVGPHPKTPAEPISHTSSKRGKTPPKKQPIGDDYYPIPRQTTNKVQQSTNSKLKDLPANFGAQGAVSGEYLTSYIRSRVERMGEGTLLQRELIANKNNSRIDALERKKMCLMQSTKKSGLTTQTFAQTQNHLEYSKPTATPGSTQTHLSPVNGAPTVTSTATSSTNQQTPVPKATSPPPPASLTLQVPPALHPAATTQHTAPPPPKEREQIKDYKLNNMFKMIDFLEHDEDLTLIKNGYRVDL